MIWDKRQNIIDYLRCKVIWWSNFNMIIQYNNGISKIINLLDGTTNQPSKFRARK